MRTEYKHLQINKCAQLQQYKSQWHLIILMIHKVLIKNRKIERMHMHTIRSTAFSTHSTNVYRTHNDWHCFHAVVVFKNTLCDAFPNKSQSLLSKLDFIARGKCTHIRIGLQLTILYSYISNCFGAILAITSAVQHSTC